MDKSGANNSALEQIIEDEDISLIVQVKYFKRIVEQDLREFEQITTPMLGFKGDL